MRPSFIWKISLCFCLLMPLLLIGQQEDTREPSTQGLSTDPGKCFQSPSAGRICVSKHGNLIELKSPSGIENIAAGGPSEGYVACVRTAPGSPVLSYFDAGSTESGWGAPGTKGRLTLDGKLELDQDFAFNTERRELYVAMTLYNRSGKTLYDVRLDRYADFNIDNSAGSDVFHKSTRAVYGVDQTTGSNTALMTELTASNYTTGIHTKAGWQRNVCNQTTAASPTAAGDWVGRISYNFGTMPNGTYRSVRLPYSVQ